MSPDIRRHPFSSEQLQHICKELADTETGLTGNEIGHLLEEIGIKDTDPDMTKWKRLFNALVTRQNQTQAGNVVLMAISKALSPARFIGKRSIFEERLQSVNTLLAFHGLQFQEDGKFHVVDAAVNLTEAEQRASRLKDALTRRSLHPELLRFCRTELLQDNYFHAVLEACKSIASTIRTITGLTSDGASLVDEALGGEAPRIKVNRLSTDTERAEQRGFANLAKGLFGTFRNPTAHAAKIEWVLSEEDAVDLLTLASYVLRRLDKRVA